jgi:hypothetical protein
MHRRGKTAGIWEKADMMISYCTGCPISRRHPKKKKKG